MEDSFSNANSNGSPKTDPTAHNEAVSENNAKETLGNESDQYSQQFQSPQRRELPVHHHDFEALQYIRFDIFGHRITTENKNLSDIIENENDKYSPNHNNNNEDSHSKSPNRRNESSH